MNDIVTGLVLLAIAGALTFAGLPNKTGISPRFLRFEAAVTLYPPLILVFITGGFAKLILGLLRTGQ